MALEAGIAELVNGFIAAGRPSPRTQSVEERRAGYVASTVLAGDKEMRVQTRSFEHEGIRFWVASPLLLSDPRPAVIYYHGGCLSAVALPLTRSNCATHTESTNEF
ncbi:hypothetical protein [Scandinavium manionii]|uniref:hypothetical protein n=1 Tax=Scandinavium manionii TaxID=2926520 RepID=UPI0021664BBE|nr:hypothetical protein [Scandinavium manionii]MCS2164394.1 hypothetical protein [Scandinavium manionii]